MRKKINRYDWSGKKTELTKKETLLYTFAFTLFTRRLHNVILTYNNMKKTSPI